MQLQIRGSELGRGGMTKYKLPNNPKDEEALEQIKLLRTRARNSVDCGHDDARFRMELDAEARRAWHDLLLQTNRRAAVR
jgi:hypothetical protein